MQNINQTVIFNGFINGNEVVNITKSRGISVMTDATGACEIATLDNDGNVLSSLNLPASQSIEVTADSGSLLQDIRVSCTSANVYLVCLGGSVVIS